VPTLEETMETLNGKVQLLIEIKKDHDTLYPGLEKKVVEIIHHYDAGKWTVVQSFNKHSVEKVQKADPSLRTFYLLGHNFPEWYNALAQSIQAGTPPPPAYTGVAPHWSVLDAGKADTLHRAGYQVYTWTVGPEEMQKILDMKVEGIITNDPDKLIALLKK
jgi:glycerophosphoryl diester phosphodiesterase